MKVLLSILSLFTALQAVAQGIRGGWMECRYYYDNPAGDASYYRIGVHVYRKSAPVGIAVFDAANGDPVSYNLLQMPDTFRGSTYQTKFDLCTTRSPLNDTVTDFIKDYTLSLPHNPNGYLIAASGFGRDARIVNVYDPAHTGILHYINIPGTINGVDYHSNTSPVPDFTDTVTVCRNTLFTYQPVVFDRDNDSLSYSLGDIIQSPTDPTTSPPFSPVQYVGTFTGANPLGTGVSINPVTGLMSGTAPDAAGLYMVALYIKEWRNGVYLTTTKKEFSIKVTNCPFVKPLLKPLYSHCRINTFTFKNEPTCPAITSWFWDFGDTNTLADTSTLAMPSYTYPGTGTYTLKLQIKGANGFSDSATSVVKILDAIAVTLPADTAVCKTDLIRLNPISDAINYAWRESGGGITLNNYAIKNPGAMPVAENTTYYVTGTLDACRDSAYITIHASPYPKVTTSPDTSICLGNSIGISGTVQAAFYNWSPVNTLTNSTTLNPVALPKITTAYVLSVRDTFYCPKTVRDTTIVTVIQTFAANAGRDTSVVVGQPLQLNASSPGTTYVLQYTWQPAAFLNNNTIQNPVAVFPATAPDVVRYSVKATTREGCSSVDDIAITVYKTGPDILVPSAFTPNGDGKNDVLKPVLLGIRKLDYFAVYNRYGQLVFTTSEAGRGWNGIINNNGGQPTETFVYIAQGTDYTGKKIFKKGSVLLIR